MNETDQQVSAAMLQIVYGFRISRAVYVTAQLGIADLLKGGPKSSEELAQATATHAPSLHRVMRALVSVGIFTENEDGRFTLTRLGATLQIEGPRSLRSWVLAHLDERHYRSWGNLMHTVQTGEPASRNVLGTPGPKRRDQDPERAELFDKAMANIIGLYSAAVVASYPFSTIGKIVDVGGGDGTLMVAVLQANPAMKGVVFDLPLVAERAERKIAEAGLSGRCEFVGGDALSSVASGGGAYILSRVIHGWDDEHAVTILKNCRRAMRSDSRLLLIERLVPTRVEPSSEAQSSLLSDLNMMVMSGGRERTEPEYRALFEAAGFTLMEVVPTGSVMVVIEGICA